MKRCTVPGCERVEQLRRGMCNMHRMRMKTHGDPHKTANRPAGSGTIRPDGYCMLEVGGRPVLRHVAIAERALGRRLPRGADVHHADGDRSNDAPSNLVICPSRAYHMLLHTRIAARDACGNPEWRPCVHCKRYDSPANLAFAKAAGSYYHRDCARRYSASKMARHAV